MEVREVSVKGNKGFLYRIKLKKEELEIVQKFKIIYEGRVEEYFFTLHSSNTSTLFPEEFIWVATLLTAEGVKFLFIPYKEGDNRHLDKSTNLRNTISYVKQY